MKLSKIFASVAAVGLVMSPIAAAANTRASASTFKVGSADFSKAALGSRSSSSVAQLHNSEDESDLILIIIGIAAIIAAILAATSGNGGTKTPGA